MARLKNRQKFIPNGFKFYDPNLRWTAPLNASFATICDGLRSARLANKGVTAAKQLATDINAIAEEVDFYNATLCEQHGWTDYITGSAGGAAAPAPFYQPPNQQPPSPSLMSRARSVAAGSEALVEWIASGAEAVPQEKANQRAAVCAKCPLNGKGGWEKWFTVPVSNAIRAALRHKGEFKLATPDDDKLGVCEACSCPMALKVWVPFEKFFPKMPQADKDALHKDCWIRSEISK